MSRWADRVGGTGALLCAVHCAASPVLIGLLPVLGASAGASTGFEQGFLLFALVVGSLSLGWGHRRHRRPGALLLLYAGWSVAAAGVWVPALHEQILLHATLLTSGGLLIAAAHWVNLRYVARAVGCADAG